MEILSNISFGLSLESKKFYLDLIKKIDKDTIFIKFWNANIGKNLGLIEKKNKIKTTLKIQRNISFGISLESKLFYLDLIKTLIKILFSSNFEMQISAKIWDYLKK